MGEINVITNNHNPYVLCFQETRFRENYTPISKEYNIFFKNKYDGFNASGGVATFVHKNFKSLPILLNSNFQVVACSVFYPIKLTICNIYLPPNIKFTKSDLVNIVNQLPQPFILCGDFNSHNSIWGSNKIDFKGKIIESIVNDFNLNIMNSPSSPTHFSSYLGTFSSIDLSICSPSVQTYFNWKTSSDLHSSDHYPIILNLCNNDVIERRPKWKLSSANWIAYQLEIDLGELNSFNNCDDRNSFLVKSILDAASKSVPKTKATPRRRPVPWFNNEIREAIRLRRKSLAVFKRYPTSINLSNFRQSRAKCRKLIIQSKKDSWNRFTSSLSLDTATSDVWNKIKSLSGQYSPTTITSLNCSLSLNTNQTHLSHNKTEILNEIGRHFQNSFSTSHYSSHFIQHQFDNSLLLQNHSNLDNYFYNDPFTYAELSASIHKSKGSSPGPDDIHYFMIKNLDASQKYELLKFYNFIWNSGTLPKAWTISFLVPILKPGKDPLFAVSFRPICLTSTVFKTMQRMVVERLSWIIEEKGFLTNNQYGFRKRRSTTDCLLILENAILKSFELKHHFVAVFFDIEKAYDRTWRDSILQTLYDWGFRGQMLHFIRNFLNNRSFQVILENSKSALFEQANGVPQGEILSVYLFLISINSVAKYIPSNIDFLLYADDLTLFVHDRSLKNCQTRLQKAIHKLSDWCSISGYSFSTTKTKALHFTKLRKYTQPIHLHLNLQNIEFVNTHKYLGLTFDRKLTWTPYLKELKTKTTRQLNILKCVCNTKWGADRDTLIHIYKSFVQSRLDYGSTVYASANEKTLLLLNTVLNLGARISIGAFRSSPVPSIICEAGLKSLEYRRQHLICSQFIRIASTPQHPLNVHIHNPQAIYSHRNRNNKSFITRASILFSHLNIDISDVMKTKFPSIPPWSLPEIPTHTELSQISRQDITYNNTIRQEYHRRINLSFKHHEVFYTDGSKSDDYSGAAFFHREYTSSIRLPTSTSSYSAELLAIIAVLDHLSTSSATHRLILICSDSLSSIQSISNIFCKNPYVIQIHEYISKLHQFQIELMWIPGHTGIYGNEQADLLAKACSSQPILHKTLSPSDLLTSCKFAISKKWNEVWSETPVSVKLRSIKTKTTPWPINTVHTRRDSVVLTRIRIGHTHYTHGFLMARTEPPICSQCLTPITVKHIIVNCAKYTNERNLQHITSIEQSAGDNSIGNTQILNFLKHIELYKLI